MQASDQTSANVSETVEDWMQQWDAQAHGDAEETRTLGRIVSEVDSRMRQSHDGPVEKRLRSYSPEEAMDIDQPILTTTPDTAEVATGGQEAMDVDEPVQVGKYQPFVQTP